MVHNYFQTCDKDQYGFCYFADILFFTVIVQIFFLHITYYLCEQVLFVYVFTIIPPCLTDQRNFITVLIVTREPEQTTLLF